MKKEFVVSAVLAVALLVPAADQGLVAGEQREAIPLDEEALALPTAYLPVATSTYFHEGEVEVSVKKVSETGLVLYCENLGETEKELTLAVTMQRAAMPMYARVAMDGPRVPLATREVTLTVLPHTDAEVRIPIDKLGPYPAYDPMEDESYVVLVAGADGALESPVPITAIRGDNPEAELGA